MKKARLIVTIIAVIFIITGCTSSGSGTTTGTDKISHESTKATDKAEEQNISSVGDVTGDLSAHGDSAVGTFDGVNDNRSATDVTISEEDIEIHSYSYEDMFGDTVYFMTFKNNAQAPICIKADLIVRDSAGTMIGVDDLSVDVIGPGEESIGYCYFDSVTGIDTVEYSISYGVSTYYKPVLANLAVEQTYNDKNVILKVTNNGEINAQFVEAYALFFDAEGNLIRYTSEYITDRDSEIKVGATLTEQLDCYGGYDSVKIFLTGRSDGSSTVARVPSVSIDNLEIKEYSYESYGDVLYYLIVKNNSEYSIGIDANGNAYDADGNVISADDMEIDVIGPGQQSIGYFYFDGGEGMDHVDYQLDVNTDLYYSDVLANLSIEQTVNEKNVIVAVTNNGDTTAEFVEAYALFFDADGNVVRYTSEYVTDDDYEINPGKTELKQIDAYQEFDHVEIYLTGRHSEW